jgi:hypothetical protein
MFTAEQRSLVRSRLVFGVLAVANLVHSQNLGSMRDGCVEDAPGTRAASEVKLRPLTDKASTCCPFTTCPTVAFSDCN